MLPNDILIEIFTKVNNPFKLQRLSKQFNVLILGNKNHIAYGILNRLGFNINIIKSYKIYKNFITKCYKNPVKYNLIDYIDDKYAGFMELLLINPKADPSIHNNVAIISAAMFGHSKTVKILLADPRVDPTADNNYAFISAAYEGHFDVVKLLLADPRVDPTDNDNEAIKDASLCGHIEVVRLLLADPRIDRFAINSAIRSAEEEGHTNVINLLLRYSRRR